MEEVIRELSELKTEIDKAKQERAELVGARKQRLSQLKGEFGLSDKKAAEGELNTLGTKKKEVEEKIHAGFTKLKEEYEW